MSGFMVRGAMLIGLAVAVLMSLSVGIATASADVAQLEAKEYRKDFGVPMAQAEEVLEAQDSANEREVVDGLEDRLDSRYAGIWFDNQSGEYVVPLLSKAGDPAVSSEFAQAGLGTNEFRTTNAQSSWAQLEAAQEALNKELLPLLEEHLIQTSLDPRTNAVVLKLAESIPAEAEQEARDLAAGSSVEVEVRTSQESKFEGEMDACKDPFCDAPLRGGVSIYPTSDPSKVCTASFPAVGANGDRYILTAGHCVHQNAEGLPTYLNWTSKDSSLTAHAIGSATQWGSGGTTEWAKIKANGSSWDTGSWPAQIAYWGMAQIGAGGTFTGKGAPVDLNYPITGQGTNVVGTFACHSGIMTGTSCGTITALNVTYSGPGGPIYNLVELSGPNVCSIPGDSGSPYFTGHSALGIHVIHSTGEQACGGGFLYVDINLATAALGVTIAPPAPKVTVSATALNGNPGWATVRGEVTSNGMGITNKTVNIKFFKWESNSWVQKAELPVTVINGSYELKNWNGVGPGSWMAKAVFPTQSPFGGSESGISEGAFEVKDGYQLVNKYSGKCLDVEASGQNNGVNMEQWECGNPATSVNQVFTLVPQGGDYYQIVARHSNRCAERGQRKPQQRRLDPAVGLLGKHQPKLAGQTRRPRLQHLRQ